MHSGSSVNSMPPIGVASTEARVNISTGIASLILEGRKLDEDDDTEPHLVTTNASASVLSQDAHRIRQKLIQLRSCPSTSRDLHHTSFDGRPLFVESSSSTLVSAEDDLDSDNDVDIGFSSAANATQQQQAKPVADAISGGLLDSLQSLATSCLKTTPRSFNKAKGLLQAVEAWADAGIVAASNSAKNVRKRSDVRSPRHGPHCDQFMRQIGLVKGYETDTATPDNGDDHKCCFGNEHCYRWQDQQRQLAAIVARGEPVCIEVYLGPENQAVLLEQWTIEHTEKLNAPSMTLPSLCSAIRSQLYFSQVSAWSDSLRQDKGTIGDNPRIERNPITRQLRLNVLYRIRAYDSTAFFTEKPIVHNFPVSGTVDTSPVSVCLKSLPRLNAIPSVSLFSMSGGGSSTVPLGGGATQSAAAAAAAAAAQQTTSLINEPRHTCTEIGKHRCTFDEESSQSETMDGTPMTVEALHREKQLLKYKKRLMKRSKKKRGECDDMSPNDDRYTPASINSIRPPLYHTTLSSQKIVQRTSVATQTDDCDNDGNGDSSSSSSSGGGGGGGEDDHHDGRFPACRQCGNDMQCVCWNCDRKLFLVTEAQMANNMLENGERLLRAIHHTGRMSSLRAGATTERATTERTDDNKSSCNQIVAVDETKENCDSRGRSDTGDCRVCKRLKTRHIYADTTNVSEMDSAAGDYRRTFSEPIMTATVDVKDTPPSSPLDIRSFRRAFSENESLPMAGDCACDYRTPTASRTPSQPPTTPLYVACPDVSDNLSATKLSKIIPKINLTALFSEPSPPQLYFHKSHSAPAVITGQSTPTALSPRFLKTAAIYRRRVRHLSDRSSDRSSIGSDDPISDEELGFGLDNTYSPISSPTKLTRTRGALFGRLPLAGNIEESLLQRRFVPVHQVSGFKVLLGASGGFCPTQLTLPATTYFYQLQGKPMNSPYVCEIRLPRKGYSVPRNGTVQATLLNPLGNVVRMFVVSYDFRDMPIMSQTFIRQRVLAFDESTYPPGTGAAIERLSVAEQMKLLRYVIHLRFQTSRSGRLSLHTDFRLIIARRADCDTAAAHAKGVLEAPNELKIVTICPDQPRYSTRMDKI